MVEMTPVQIAWRDRALVDFRFFCKYLNIRIKDERPGSEIEGQLAPFIWRPAQEVVWAWMQAQMKAGIPVELVILKARQFGITTFFCAWLFWQMWRKNHVRTMVAVAKKGLTMNVVLETMDRFYQSLPEGFRPKLRGHGERVTKEEVYFDDRKSGSNIVAADVKDSGRSDALDHAFWTEVGSTKRADEFFKEFSPAMARRSDTTLVLESTAAPGYFRSKYLNAKTHNNATFLPWSAAPEMYSRKLKVTKNGNRRTLRDALTNDVVKLCKADYAEMEFLSKQHEKINEIVGKSILPPVTEEQMWWWHWYCETQYEGDDEFMRQEFPRDDVSAFEYGAVSAFKTCLPTIRASVEAMTEECPDVANGHLEALTDLSDVSIDDHHVLFHEEEKITRFWQEEDPGLLVFKPPVAGYTYTLGVDVADDIGTSMDPEEANFSVICVYCANTREQVAEWRGQIDPHDLGDEVAKVGYWYNTALACVEYNNVGISTINRLTKYLQYPNRFKWPILDEAGKLHKKKEMWVTRVDTKNLMITHLRHAIRNGLFIVRSVGLQEELMGYQKSVSGGYEAGPDTFADRIIAAALAWQAVEQTDYGMAQVLGADVEKPVLGASGQAKKFIEQTHRSVWSDVPRMLPAEFDDMEPVQKVEESDWIWKAFEEVAV